MKFKRQRRFEAEVATASLNDIMFFLMLFFLIVSTLGIQDSMKVNLPQSDNSTKDQINKEPIVLTIKEGGKYYIESNQINFPNLEERLKLETTGKEDPTIVIKAEQNLTIQDLVDVMSIGARLKVRMVLATEGSK
jgi:biopolymer transport protein ExbD